MSFAKKAAILVVVGVVGLVVVFFVVCSSLQPGGTLYGTVQSRVAAATDGTLTYEGLDLRPTLSFTCRQPLWAGKDGTRFRIRELTVDPSVIGLVTGGAVPLDELDLAGGALEHAALRMTELRVTWTNGVGTLTCAEVTSPRLEGRLAIDGTVAVPGDGSLTCDLTA